MRKLCVLIVLSCAAWSSSADLQNVTVGGEVRLRARHWSSTYETAINGPGEIRIPAMFLPKRPIGPFGTVSRYDWDERGNSLDFVEHRTRLNVNADFTDHVRGFIELESYDLWGRDFRSNYLTGADTAAATGDDVEVYQSYIETSRTFDWPLRLRIGRQEMKLGKGWLVDDITTALIGRSFDGIRATYGDGPVTVDAWWSKLNEVAALEEDGDVDFYGVYGSYDAGKALNASLYWMYIRDAGSLNDTNFTFPAEWLENLFGLDDYDPTHLHTVGTRIFGAVRGFDYDLELAYQFGDADRAGFGFKPNGLRYGDDDAEFDAWGGDLEVGYAFDMAWKPRVYLGGAYFEGEDRRDISFVEWLSPFYEGDASISFNRLFPGKPYSFILEIGQDMSNFWQIRGGVTARPNDAVTVGVQAALYGVDETFEAPKSISIGRFKVPLAPNLSFWTEESDDNLGVTTHVFVNYQYSEDLVVRAGWEHLFTGDGLADGNFTHRYGLEFNGGTSDDDADYFYVDTSLKF